MSELYLNAMKTAFSSDVEPKAYALITPIDGNESFHKSYNVMKIRPLNVSRDQLHLMYSGTDSFSFICGGACLFAKKDEPEEAFLLRVAVNGIIPEIRIIENDNYETVDIIDMETGISFIKIRENAIKNKKEQK